MERIVVTGASGFIGRNCVDQLTARGLEVHAISSHAHVSPEGAVFWHRCDLLKPHSIDAILEEVRPSHLLHLAWYAAPGKFWTAPENLAWCAASVELLRSFAEQGGSRAVFAGTCAEYDWRFGYCSEDVTPTNPQTLYGVCKRALSDVAFAFAKISGIEVAWARLFHLYGPHEQAGRLVSSVARALARGERVRCSSGSQVRDYMHVKDAAAALACLCQSRFVGPINVASGEPIAVRQIVEILADSFKRPDLIDWGSLLPRAGDPAVLMADIRHLQGIPGWAPATPIDQGLRATARWWRTQSNSNEN